MPEAFPVTFFNGSHDNDEVKSQAYLLLKSVSLKLPLKNVALYFILVMTAIEKCNTKSFWHGFTESHFKILYC